MSKIIKHVFFSGLFLLTCSGYSQSRKNIERLVVNSHIYCHHCQSCETCGGLILKNLYNEDGIRHTEVDAKANTITVVFDSRKISANQIRHKISKLGYDADSLRADSLAVERLESCCKK